MPLTARRRHFDDAITALEWLGCGVLALGAGIGVWQVATFFVWLWSR